MDVLILRTQALLARGFQALRRRWRWLDGPSKRIVRIRVTAMHESCQRWTFYVELTTDEGFTMTPCCHVTGSLYTDFKGLSKEEACERAVTEAMEWGDFLLIPVDPYVLDGVLVEPDILMDTYTGQREDLAERLARL